ncbi:glutaredoxin family protein [Pseudobacillus badius]|uniref:glutaredoxin family protein n=1 Tax=Bacillus badius TaxID=1455 RepID=UPI0024A2BF9F|nr:glutaredoxin family protein [Bacillus badius]GLY12628.1 hypothetical protein Bbad01_38440 [Bacillus badius]
MELLVYSSSSCIYCQRQRRFLTEKGISFEEKDIHENEVNFKEFKDFGGYGTPFTLVKANGNIVSKIVGFNPEKLLEKLGSK